MKYYQKIIVVIVMFLWRCLVCAQVLTGVVCDKATKLPVPNVHVYLNGTSINTITNVSGKFELKTSTVINTVLVLHHLSYERSIIDRPFNKLLDTLYIEEQIRAIDEVIVVADRFTREQKMKAFREQFLGTSRAGKSCAILNEDDIQLTVNIQSRRLLATSDKPIIVVHNYLGYQVSFSLIDFWVQYGYDVILNSDYIQNSFFSVVSSFTDLASDKRRIKRRRDSAYVGSANFFFKCFANDSLKENSFRLFNNKGYSIKYEDYFEIKDTLSQKMIGILPNTDINAVRGVYTTEQTKPSGVIRVSYRRSNLSDIYFMTDTLLVDPYGNIDQIDKIFFSGQMGENRAGDMLPIDYYIPDR
jgi:hypothetical protein